MNIISVIFNSPGHWLIAMLVGDITMAYLVLKYGYRFLRKLVVDIRS